jgi:mono/diheme cytochrome c family protein
MKSIVLGALLTALLATEAFAAGNLVAAGRYQAVLGDCEGCHTLPGGKSLAGGEPLATPFGDIVAPNITPDRQTGIGGWSEEEFRRAMKEGVAPGGVRLYPAMPYPAYAHMGDGDIAALWAYLRTVKPVHSAAAANHLRFPYNIRLLLCGWNLLYFRPQAYAADAAKSPLWNRGTYLVTGPGHCGACHTPKTMFGADSEAALRGASLQGWFAPDLSGDKRTGLGAWSSEDIVQYLKTGRNAHCIASGPMREAIENSTSKMTDGDLKAIAAYLKDLPASASGPAVALSANDVHMKAGAAVYHDNCAACHGGDGRGEGALSPPLAGNVTVTQTSAESLTRVVLAGAQAVQTKGAPTAPAMPSFAWRLKDGEIADMLTYIRNNWGNAAAPVSAESVGESRARLRGS